MGKEAGLEKGDVTAIKVGTQVICLFFPKGSDMG